MSQCKIYIFSKTPGYSEVMSRITKDGLNGLEIQTKLIEYMKCNLSTFDCIWAIAESAAMNSDFWKGQNLILQDGDNFEERMISILKMAKRESSPFILTGSDYPQLDLDEIQLLLKSLKKNNFSFIAAQDGGFTAVAMRRDSDINVFKKVKYSSHVTLSQILSNINERKQKYEIIKTSFDIDTKDNFDELVKLERFSKIFK